MAKAIGRLRSDDLGERRVSGYLTVRETADVLNMHFMSVYKLVQSGQLPAVKIGSRWKIDPGQLDHWIDRRRGVQPDWLLIATPPALRDALGQALGDGARIRRVELAHLAGALADSPDVVVVDPTIDPHAALAALDVCRDRERPPMAVLLVRDVAEPALADALTRGPVTVLRWPATTDDLAQLARCLARE